MSKKENHKTPLFGQIRISETLERPVQNFVDASIFSKKGKRCDVPISI